MSQPPKKAGGFSLYADLLEPEKQKQGNGTIQIQIEHAGCQGEPLYRADDDSAASAMVQHFDCHNLFCSTGLLAVMECPSQAQHAGETDHRQLPAMRRLESKHLASPGFHQCFVADLAMMRCGNRSPKPLSVMSFHRLTQV